ncbi:MAG: hypothetical protein JO062_06210 [Bryobacterales bacterium]|nr:hypothetical protein [Bryobacterales bacterium]
MWWLLALAGIFGAALPLFCFALYRNEQPLAFSRRHRGLALAAAAVLAANFLWTMAALIKGLYLEKIRGQSWTYNEASSLITPLPDITIVLLLLTVWWKSPDESPSQTSAELLRTLSLAAVVIYGLLVMFLFVRLPLLPIAINQLSDLARKFGRTPPSLVAQFTEGVRLLLVQGSIFIAPFIVWRATRRKARSHNGLQTIEAEP